MTLVARHAFQSVTANRTSFALSTVIFPVCFVVMCVCSAVPFCCSLEAMRYAFFLYARTVRQATRLALPAECSYGPGCSRKETDGDERKVG
jgi:hypothetical protein